MKQTITVTKKELDDLIMYHKYKSEYKQLCDGCSDKGYCCGCKTADAILQPLEIVERRLPPDIFKCELVMNNERLLLYGVRHERDQIRNHGYTKYVSSARNHTF